MIVPDTPIVPTIPAPMLADVMVFEDCPRADSMLDTKLSLTGLADEFSIEASTGHPS